jgi:hypothetical protein
MSLPHDETNFGIGTLGNGCEAIAARQSVGTDIANIKATYELVAMELI